MKKLGTLIRLQKRELDEKRARMVQLENKRNRFITQMEELSEALQQEYRLADEMPDLRGFFGDFSGAIKQQQQQLAAQIVQTETQIQQLSQQILDQFTELKKYEIAKERYDATAKRAANHKEQMQLDEIGIRNAVYMVTD